MNSVFLSSKIYRHSMITETCSAFSKLAQIQVSSSPNGWTVSFSNAVCPTVLLISEFENYLINLSCIKHSW